MRFEVKRSEAGQILADFLAFLEVEIGGMGAMERILRFSTSRKLPALKKTRAKTMLLGGMDTRSPRLFVRSRFGGFQRLEITYQIGVWAMS